MPDPDRHDPFLAPEECLVCAPRVRHLDRLIDRLLELEDEAPPADERPRR